MKFENTEVWGFKHAIRGMRNPLESWNKSDSVFCSPDGCAMCEEDCESLDWYEDSFAIGNADMKLMKNLISAGSEHRKFLRQIMVSVDISAPIYFFKEFDTYRIGVTENSTSTMHKLTSKPITRSCFEHGDLIPDEIINHLENLRKGIFEPSTEVEEKKALWKALIVCLPESWIQTRTVTMNYENLLNMVHQRKNHKLTEWSVDFIEWVKSLPYANDLIFSAIETRENEK